MKTKLAALNRRDLLNLSMTATGASLITASQPLAQADELPQRRIIDTNVSLFQWPFRRLPLDDTTALVAKLATLGIAQAWAGSFEGILHRDMAAVNHRLAAACQHQPMLVPVGTINPELPDWREDFRRCVDEHHMPGIRLYPNYHGYTVDDPRFAQLLALATSAGRFVQLATALEDTRTQLALVRVADVNLAALSSVMSRIADVRVQLLNYRPNASALATLAKTSGLYFDTARVEATDGVPGLVNQTAPGRVMFGSHAPFLIPEAALIRVHESGLLDEPAIRGVLWENAEVWMRTTNQ